MFALICLAMIAGTPTGTFAAKSHSAKSHKNAIKEFESWPQGASPEEIGKRVAERYANGPHTNFGRPTPPAHITYPETCTWYGSLTFAQLIDEKDLTAMLTARFDPLFGDDSKLIPNPVNVDSTVFGAVPLQL